jgi:hypothetical protein
MFLTMNDRYLYLHKYCLVLSKNGAQFQLIFTLVSISDLVFSKYLY